MSSKEQHTQLMNRVAKHRDRAAFSELVQYFGPRLTGFLLSRGAGTAQVGELVQEVMIKVWLKAESFDPTRAQLSTWIFTIARNQWLDRTRKQRRPRVDPTDPTWVPASPQAPDQALDAQRSQDRIHTALGTLPPEQAQIIALSYLQGIPQRTIAEDLGLPIGTVKSRTRLALSRLREAMVTAEKTPQAGIQ
jgi:RNA polymerase sigma-70 factor (ECF subfamily)